LAGEPQARIPPVSAWGLAKIETRLTSRLAEPSDLLSADETSGPGYGTDGVRGTEMLMFAGEGRGRTSHGLLNWPTENGETGFRTQATNGGG